MDLVHQIDSMDSAEALRCLNGVLEGLTSSSPTFAELLSSADGEDLTTVMRESATQVGAVPPLEITESAIKDRGVGVKLVLQEMAQSALKPRVENWLSTHRRAELFEPITAAIVLAGIVAVLSADVEFNYTNDDGKQSLKVVVRKKPSAEKLLEKFFLLFK